MNKPRLIDATKLNRDDLCNFCGSADCANCFEDEAFEKWIAAQPTAYDIDKVVEQLEELSPENECFDFEEDYIYAEKRHNRYIEIVKGGAE